MPYLSIINDGEIDLNAFKLLGACTKRNDSSKIGFFGSGLKYSIAFMLRNGVDFKVFSGINEIFFSTTPVTMRGLTFQSITINGEQTSMTTSMGPDWVLWQAVRELICNAIDEGTNRFSIVPSISCEQGKTAIFVNADAIKEIIDKWDIYFSFSRTPVACEHIFSSISNTVNIYRKGIRCFDSSNKSLYDYNLEEIEINESRTILYEWRMRNAVAKLWGLYANSHMIEQLQTIDASYLENNLDWDYVKFSDVWLDTLKDKVLVPSSFAGYFTTIENRFVISYTLIKQLESQFGDALTYATRTGGEKYAIIEPTKKQTYLLNEATKWLFDAGFECPYEISIAYTITKTTLATVSSDKIILMSHLFDLGKREIIAAIIEEWQHIESKAADNTRQFQNVLLNKIIMLLEEKTGLFL